MKKNQLKIYKSRRSFLQKTTFFASFFVSSLMYSSAHSKLDWQKACLSFPETPIHNEDGTQLHLKQFIGKPLIINFWATWCAPCIIELPHLDSAVDYFKRKDVSLLLVSTDRSPRHEVSSFLDNMRVFKPLRGYDPKAVWARKLDISALPVTFLINADQTKFVYLVGTADWSEPHVINEVIAQLSLLN